MRAGEPNNQVEWDARFMRLALDLAHRARQQGEVPVGAIVVVAGEVIGSGHNGSVARTDPTAHAEILALRDAAARTGNYRLVGAMLYSTVEPCLMCLGAAMHARIGRLVYGAADAKLGGVGRLEVLRELEAGFNHRFETAGGLLADEASSLLRGFFRERRSSANASPSGYASSMNGEVPKWS